MRFQCAALLGVTISLASVACGDDDAEATTGASGDGGATSTATTSAQAVSTALGAISSGGEGAASGTESTSAGQGGAGGGDPTPRVVFDPIAVDTELNLVTEVRFLPDALDELLVLEKGGAVHHFRLEGDTAVRLGGFTLTVHDDLDCGLISVAFSNDFAVDRAFYAGFCESRYASRVDRFVLDIEDYDGVPATGETIIVLDEPDAAQPWHNVGSIGLEPDGTMWILSGEKTVETNARDLSRDLGKLLRVVPDPDGPGSTPAPDNPFVGEDGKSPNVWAYGLRSPWKGVRDRRGWYWFGDVGQDTFEEVNLVKAPASDYGWPDHEGPCDAELDDGCIDPVAYYGRSSSDPYLVDDPDHLSAGTRAVWVGAYVEPVEDDPYQGAFDDRLIFGDLHTGFVRTLHVGEDGEILADEPLAHLNHGHSWNRGADGHLYVMTFGTLLSSDTRTAELFRMRLE